MKNIPKQYHSAVRKLIKKAREDESTKLLNEIRELVEGMSAMTLANPTNNHPANAYKMIDRNDLLSELNKLETTNEEQHE